MTSNSRGTSRPSQQMYSCARTLRFDLLQRVTLLAKEVSRWTRACDNKLFRRICYNESTLVANLISHIGDPISHCRYLLFKDFDFAGTPWASKSTTGASVASVGPRTSAPIVAASKGQAAVSHSSTEAEMIAVESVHIESRRASRLGF